MIALFGSWTFQLRLFYKHENNRVICHEHLCLGSSEALTVKKWFRKKHFYNSGTINLKEFDHENL